MFRKQIIVIHLNWGFSGESYMYQGPSNISMNNFYLEGEVKVRVWLAADLPPAVFDTSLQMQSKYIILSWHWKQETTIH